MRTRVGGCQGGLSRCGSEALRDPGFDLNPINGQQSPTNTKGLLCSAAMACPVVLLFSAGWGVSMSRSRPILRPPRSPRQGRDSTRLPPPTPLLLRLQYVCNTRVSSTAELDARRTKTTASPHKTRGFQVPCPGSPRPFFKRSL